jgi:hypothetical protein
MPRRVCFTGIIRCQPQPAAHVGRTSHAWWSNARSVKYHEPAVHNTPHTHPAGPTPAHPGGHCVRYWQGRAEVRTACSKVWSWVRRRRRRSCEGWSPATRPTCECHERYPPRPHLFWKTGCVIVLGRSQHPDPNARGAYPPATHVLYPQSPFRSTICLVDDQQGDFDGATAVNTQGQFKRTRLVRGNHPC